MEYIVEEKIKKLSKMYNYYNNKAIDIIKDLNRSEAEIVLNDSSVEHIIFSIDNKSMLRIIFKYVPDFFKKKMLLNDSVVFNLLVPRNTLTEKKFNNSYQKSDIVFSNIEINELVRFINSIKNIELLTILKDNKYFQMILPLIYEDQVEKSFLDGIDKVSLFNSIINNEYIYNTRKARKKNIVNLFNKISNQILLPQDYKSVISDTNKFMNIKRWMYKEAPIVTIDDDTFNILTDHMLNLLIEFRNIDNEMIKNKLKSNILSKLKDTDEFTNIFACNNGMICFRYIYYYYFSIILEATENNKELQNKFLDFLISSLCPNEKIKREAYTFIKQSLYYKILNNEISKDDYSYLFYYSSSVKTMFYLKFNKIDYRFRNDWINAEQLTLLNVKHVNQIKNLINFENEDELTVIYSTTIRMYMVFGLERAIKILKGTYGDLKRNFFENLNKVDITNIEFLKEGKKYIPVINNEFIDFMFATEKENHFKDMLSKNNLLSRYWYYLFNEFKEIKERCHDVVTLKKVDVILTDLTPEKELGTVSPDNYRLQKNEILNDICLGNKTNKSNKEVYKNVLDIYSKMKLRIESSIPYVSGKCSNGYTYEMMRLDDPIIFTLGYKGNCCIRVNDIAHNHLLHAALCRNGRVLLIYDEKHDFKAFVPLKRNGEVLIANSIECAHKKEDKKSIEAFSSAIPNILKSLNKNDEINLVCIGKEAYARPNGEEFPGNLSQPTIFEKDDDVYCNTDCYHKKLVILYKSDTMSLRNIKTGNPNVSYYDPREEIKKCDFYKRNEDDMQSALEIINYVRYTNSSAEEKKTFNKLKYYGLRYAIYNSDWYLLVDINNEIYGEYINTDIRAEKEINTAYIELQKEFNITEKYKRLILNKR